MEHKKTVYRGAVARKAHDLIKIATQIFVGLLWLAGVLSVALVFHSAPASVALELAVAGMAFGLAGMISARAKGI